jgi:hypothetical protein
MNQDLLIYTSEPRHAAFIAVFIVSLDLPFRADKDLRGGYGFTMRNIPLGMAGMIKQTVEHSTTASVTEL